MKIRWPRLIFPPINLWNAPCQPALEDTDMSLSRRIKDSHAAPWVLEEIKKLEAERDEYRRLADQWRDDWTAAMDQRNALAAHVERLAALGSLIARNLDDGGSMEDLDDLLEKWPEAVSDAPDTSLARLKAKAKAEAFENLANYAGHWTQADMLAIASDYRRQAEEDGQ